MTMGYECPVCGTPQTDRRHLADHLAVTAMTHGADHEDWLDAHVPDWGECSPRELGAAVADHADETEYGAVFEDTVGTRGEHADHEHDSGPGTLEDALADATRTRGRGDLAAADRSVLREARAMTRAMLGGDDDDATDATEGAGADAGATGNGDAAGPDDTSDGDGDGDGDGERTGDE